ncbi:metalloregulator ArsR/SmtB family transcription factor [Breoghania sp.]|uniref:ArsR/SmtB family transcription factor n=1 Tax=Breoghania sp. TaxID=2065378 RepID=UPI0026338A6E|nr:metalloregulator ArsR/SmtB family transcription factor [Breoghania sp.]MDJ0932754.1 metalloregulator ArsR/SmtB family transcription factor [Breoghania sp.]
MILAVLSALAEPTTRLQAMRILSDGEEHCICELMAQIEATQSRMPRHMQVLKQAGLVIDRRDTQWVRYRRNPNLSEELATTVDAILAVPEAKERQAA